MCQELESSRRLDSLVHPVHAHHEGVSSVSTGGSVSESVWTYHPTLNGHCALPTADGAALTHILILRLVTYCNLFTVFGNA